MRKNRINLNNFIKSSIESSSDDEFLNTILRASAKEFGRFLLPVGTIAIIEFFSKTDEIPDDKKLHFIKLLIEKMHVLERDTSLPEVVS